MELEDAGVPDDDTNVDCQGEDSCDEECRTEEGSEVHAEEEEEKSGGEQGEEIGASKLDVIVHDVLL